MQSLDRPRPFVFMDYRKQNKSNGIWFTLCIIKYMSNLSTKPTSMWLSKNPTGNIYQEMIFTLEHTSYNFILGKYIPLNSVFTPGCTKPSWIIKQVYESM